MRTKYCEGATGPDQYDCGAFVKAVATEVFHIDIPDLREIEERCGDVTTDTRKIVEVLYNANFRPVDDPEPGDVVAISRMNNGYVDHIGMMIDNSRFVQMNRKGPEITPVSSVPYRRRIKGYYRCRT